MRAISLLFTTLIVVTLFAGCWRKNTVDDSLNAEMPRKIVWAWERPEDLRFLDPKEFGVAFLAQTILLENDIVAPKRRRQPLDVSPRTYMIAVTRIETNKEGNKRPAFDEAMVQRTASLIRSTLDLPDVRSIQIDFDAAASERVFYRELMVELKLLTPEIPVTMTSLASWCTGDVWFNDFPVAEAVPMVFQMGADAEKIKTFLRNGNDWPEPLCRGSYGISLDEDLGVNLKHGRRSYYFKSTPWSPRDLDALSR